MSSSQSLSIQRRSIFPLENDTWETIAAREFPDTELKEAVSNLQSWNLHVFMRRVTGKDSYRPMNQILPSDVVFLEPPQA